VVATNFQKNRIVQPHLPVGVSLQLCWPVSEAIIIGTSIALGAWAYRRDK
jgi:hypothetical protein